MSPPFDCVVKRPPHAHPHHPHASCEKVSPTGDLPQDERPLDLSTLLLNFGSDPSTNLTSILEFGPHFIGCQRIHYADLSELSEETSQLTEEEQETVTHLTLVGCNKRLSLFGQKENLSSENIKIFTALLIQQERRLLDTAELVDLQDYTKTLFEANPNGIVVLDINGTIIDTNRAMVAMTRKPMEDLIGLKIAKLTSKEGRAKAFLALRKLQSQSKSHFESLLTIGAQRTTPVSVCFSQFHFQDQTKILVTVRDLSYLKEKSQKSSTTEERLARSIDNATDGYVRYDQSGRITQVNSHIEKLTGCFATRLVGRPIDDLLSDSSLRAFRKAVSELNATGYSSFSGAIKTSDGTEIPARATLMQFELEGQRYNRLMLQDIRNWKLPSAL